MTYMLYGTFFMLAPPTPCYKKGHIRTDTYYGAWSVQRQGLVDAICYLVFFFPALLAFVYVGWEYFCALVSCRASAWSPARGCRDLSASSS